MRIIPGQPIRRYDHHGVELAVSGCVAQTVEGRAIKPGTADPIINILMLGQQRPPVVLNMVLERAPFIGGRTLSFEGKKMTASVMSTFLRGQLIYDDGRAVGKPQGQYLHRPYG